MTKRNEQAIGLRRDFEQALWMMFTGSGDKDVDDITQRTVDVLSKQIAALPATDLDALTAKSVVAYFWAQDGAGWLERIKANGCEGERANADVLIAAVEVLAPEFKAMLDEWLVESSRPIAA